MSPSGAAADPRQEGPLSRAWRLRGQQCAFGAWPGRLAYEQKQDFTIDLQGATMNCNLRGVSRRDASRLGLATGGGRTARGSGGSIKLAGLLSMAVEVLQAWSLAPRMADRTHRPQCSYPAHAMRRPDAAKVRKPPPALRRASGPLRPRRNRMLNTHNTFADNILVSACVTPGPAADAARARPRRANHSRPMVFGSARQGGAAERRGRAGQRFGKAAAALLSSPPDLDG